MLNFARNPRTAHEVHFPYEMYSVQEIAFMVLFALETTNIICILNYNNNNTLLHIPTANAVYACNKTF